MAFGCWLQLWRCLRLSRLKDAAKIIVRAPKEHRVNTGQRKALRLEDTDGTCLKVVAFREAPARGRIHQSERAIVTQGARLSVSSNLTIGRHDLVLVAPGSDFGCELFNGKSHALTVTVLLSLLTDASLFQSSSEPRGLGLAKPDEGNGISTV